MGRDEIGFGDSLRIGKIAGAGLGIFRAQGANLRGGMREGPCQNPKFCGERGSGWRQGRGWSARVKTYLQRYT